MSQLRSDVEPQVTIVVVNFNGGAYVLECLAGLRRQTCRDFVAVVVDNDSADGSRAEIAAHFPEVRLLAAGSNLGFAGGVNLALDQAVRSEWLALLNPDAVPEPDWLAALLSAARRHPEAAAFGSQLRMTEDPLRLDGIGDAYHVSGLAWRSGHGRYRSAADERPREIFSPCAAAALYRTVAVRDVGGLDADLFCYLEDVDLGFRLRLSGHACRYVPEAVVLHAGSAIAGRRSDFQTYHGHRNMVWVFVKNMPGPLFWLFLPLHVAMNGLVLAALALQGRGRAAWRGKCDALRGLGRVWRKRHTVQGRRRIGVFSLARLFSWLPFRR